MTDPGFRPNELVGSFRDPDGCLLSSDGRILRLVRESATPQIKMFLSSTTAREFGSTGRLVRTEVLGPAAVEEQLGNTAFQDAFCRVHPGMVLEHERIPFPTFPYEWPPEMLHEAGGLLLDLVDSLMPEGLGLKDATPDNVLFRGPWPVFVDFLSVEQRSPNDPTWLPYGQFVRTFLLPLLVNKELGVPLGQLFLVRRDGLEPEEAYRLFGHLRRLMPPVLTLVTIPTWLGARHPTDQGSIYRKKSVGSPEKAQFILRSLFRQLRRALSRVAPAEGKESSWSQYMDSDCNYTPAQFQAKQQFVEQALAEFRPRQVLDVGCNTGLFSILAAKAGAKVLAIDSDPVVVGQMWRTARAARLDILPAVVNLARPSPAVGWRNRECPAFLDRARGSFDAVLMLAVVHHMLINDLIPLPEILSLAADLTRDVLLMEFVAPDDPNFQRMTHGRDYLFCDLTLQAFEAAWRPHFECLRSTRLEGMNRWLYLLRKKR